MFSKEYSIRKTLYRLHQLHIPEHVRSAGDVEIVHLQTGIDIPADSRPPIPEHSNIPHFQYREQLILILVYFPITFRIVHIQTGATQLIQFA